MRITAHRMLDLAASATARAQGQAAEVSAQISSGKRVAVASDDPTAWAQARRADAQKQIDSGRGSAAATARESLQDTEIALATLTDVLTHARTLAIHGANGTLDAQDRADLAAEVRSLFDTALAAANTRNGAGEYVLAGSLVAAAPFAADGTYQGDAIARSIELSADGTRVVAVTGEQLDNVLLAISDLADALTANDQVAVQAAIDTLADEGDQVLEAHTSIGGMMIALDSSDEARAETELALTERISTLTDADIVRVAAEFAQANASFDASQLIATRLSQLLSPLR